MAYYFRLLLRSFLWSFFKPVPPFLWSVFMSVSICIIEHWFRCWRQEENSTNIFQAWPLFFCDRPNTQPILSLLKGWKGNRFLRSHLLMFVTTKNHWLAKLRWTENWFQQNEGVLLIMWWQMLECSKHDRKMMHAFWIHKIFWMFVLKSP